MEPKTNRDKFLVLVQQAAKQIGAQTALGEKILNGVRSSFIIVSIMVNKKTKKHRSVSYKFSDSDLNALPSEQEVVQQLEQDLRPNAKRKPAASPAPEYA